MNEPEKYRLAELIEKRINETISEAEFAELESLLLENPEARQLFLDLNYQHAGIQMLEESLVQEQLQAPTPRTKLSFLKIAAAVAACLFIALSGWLFNRSPRSIATLVSSENAAWESSLPTTPGAELTKGFLRLKTGVATIRFRSGAQVVLEAPAHLILETPMKGKLLAGSAVIDVPEPAIGFVIETPDGYAVDHGTQFAVSVDAQNRQSDFEVLSGEISVHHPETGDEIRLFEKESSQATSNGLEKSGPLKESALAQSQPTTLRITTEGNSASVIRKNDSEYLHKDMLMVKRSPNLKEYDRHSLFGFKIPPIQNQAVSAVRLRLNLVPSGLGFAARLPEVNRFAIYGLPDKWPTPLVWENAPTPDQGTLLGVFDVPRSRQTGSYGIETPELLNYINSRSGSQASFLIIRETVEEKGMGLVHAFASDSHPEASGPILELIQN